MIVDHAIHEYHGALGAGFLREAGTTWGYDPFFMAGYPETPVWDSSSNLAILFDLLGGPGTAFRAYKVGLFAASVWGWWPCPRGPGRRASAGARWRLAAALASVYFWVGYPIALWRRGLFAFLSAAIGAGLLLGLCVRFDRQPSRGGLAGVDGGGRGALLRPRHGADPGRGGASAFYRWSPGGTTGAGTARSWRRSG